MNQGAFNKEIFINQNHFLAQNFSLRSFVRSPSKLEALKIYVARSFYGLEKLFGLTLNVLIFSLFFTF